MSDWLDAGILGLAALSSYQSSRAAGSAANAQADAANRAAELSQSQFALTRQDLAPWRAVGEDALYRQAASLGIIPTAPGFDRNEIFRDSPGYQFALDEGQKAIETSAAQRGMLQSGQTLKGLQDYGQNMADQRYQQYLNNLGLMSGTGQQTATQVGQFGAQSAGAQGAAAQNAAQARASGYLGKADAWGQGLGDVAGYLGYRYA